MRSCPATHKTLSKIGICELHVILHNQPGSDEASLKKHAERLLTINEAGQAKPAGNPKAST